MYLIGNHATDASRWIKFENEKWSWTDEMHNAAIYEHHYIAAYMAQHMPSAIKLIFQPVVIKIELFESEKK